MTRRRLQLKFNCYLLREGVVDPQSALRPKYRVDGQQQLTQIDPSGGAPAGVVGFLGSSQDHPPTWAEPLEAVLPGLTGHLSNRSSRLVIFLPVTNRSFALCFGHGLGVLDWDQVDANFGLRVAARRFDPVLVKEVKTRRIDSSGRVQSVQVPSGGRLDDLGVQLDGEFARRLAGRMILEDGSTDGGPVVAADSIAFRSIVDLETVETTLRAMLHDVAETSARPEFEFIDALEPLRKGASIVGELDRRVVDDLLGVDRSADHVEGSDPQVLQFAPPDDVDPGGIEQFVISVGARQEAVDDLSLDSVRAALDRLDVGDRPTILDRVKILAIDGSGDAASEQLGLRHWLVYESQHLTDRFILTVGHWFKLQQQYADRLDADLEKIDNITTELSLSDAEPGEVEKAYNVRAASLSDDLLLMDGKLIKTSDGKMVEACDLFSTGGQLIRVKRYNGSATMSHLLAQGTVSAELLNGDSVAKEDFCAKVGVTTEHPAWPAQKAPAIVTYAMIVPEATEVPSGLPTFTKVNLRDSARRLRQLRVRPTIAKITIRKPIS